MLRIHKRIVVLVALAGLFSGSAWADPLYPGEAAVVIHYCGKPDAENRDTSPSTGNMRRELYYGDTIMHFQPVEKGWGYTSAWQGSFPISKRALEARMPCFHQAMLQIAATPGQVVDPTIALQTARPAFVGSNSFGVPFLWLILALAIVLILVATLPATGKKKGIKLFKPEDREFRKPDIISGFHEKARDSARLDV